MKIKEQVLSREQMARLVELGVDTSDASLAWFMSPNTNQWKIKAKNNFTHELLLRLSPERYIPTYTTGDLIEKLPIEIGTLNRGIVIQRSYVGAGYIKDNLSPVSFSNSPLLESLYNLLCWVAENHKELL